MKASWLLIGALLQPAVAWACKTSGPERTLEEDFVRATSVVIAKVTRIEALALDRIGDKPTWPPPAAAALDVRQVLKGTSQSFEIVEAQAASNCEVMLWPGVNYVLFFDSAGDNGRLPVPLRSSFPVDPSDDSDLQELQRLLTLSETP